jgi:hypothetical protein
MDALAWPHEAHKPFTARGAAALFQHIGEVECRPCPTVGVGEDWRLEAEDIVGQALVADDVCVHLSEHGLMRGAQPKF